MKRFKPLATVGVAMSIIGILVGCGNAVIERSTSTHMANRSLTNTVKKTTNTTVGHSAPTNAPQSSANQSGTNATITFGTSQSIVTSTNSAYLTSIQMVNDRVGYANGYRNGRFTLWKTTNTGEHWSKVSQSVVQVANEVVQINFHSEQDGWIRAFSGGVMNQGDMTIFHTMDRGQTWHMVSSTGGYMPNKRATPHALPAMDERFIEIDQLPQLFGSCLFLI